MGRVDDTIRAAHAAIAERQHLSGVIARLTTELERESLRVAELQSVLEAEQRDVQRYERGAWAFVYGLFVDRETRLTKEQREAALAEARHREAVANRDELAERKVALEARRAALADAEARLELARAEKRAALAGTPVASELDGYAARLGGLEAELKNLDEAIVAGHAAAATLEELAAALESAKNWGTFDVLSDNLIASLKKRQKLDLARSIAGVAQARLTLFTHELGDLGLTLEATAVVAADKGRFIDVWADNLWSDLAVQQRIANAQKTCATAISHVASRLHAASQRRQVVVNSHAELRDVSARRLDES